MDGQKGLESALSFRALLQKLQEQHDEEVAELNAKIQHLQAAHDGKPPSISDNSTELSPKATLGPRVARPSPISATGGSSPGEQLVPKEYDVSEVATPRSPKPTGDVQDVVSVEGEGGDFGGKPFPSLPNLQVPPQSPQPAAVSPGSNMRSTTGSFSITSPKPSDDEEEAPRTLLERFKRFVRSDMFDLVVGLCVTLNFFTMAMELQYEGLQSGYELKIRFFDQTAVAAWPWAVDFFQVCRTIFLVFFTSEILLRFCFLRTEFFKTPFNVIDLLALLASIVELFSWNLPVDPTLLRLCRLAKLFRTIRVLKVSGMLDSLSLLARCMSSSGLTLVWSLLFLLVIQLIAAMIVCYMVRPFLEDPSQDEERRQEVYRYYGTFTIAVLTLFEVFFANWAPACRVLVENISEWYSLLFLIYRCGIGFAVINVVNAVFVQQTMQVAKGDEEVLLLEKQKAEEKYLKNVAKIFQALDTSGDGLLSWAEFEVLLQDHKLKFLLDKLEIAAGDLKTLFDLLDDTGDGEISVPEFIEGVTRFKGTARSLDIGQLLLRSRRLERGLTNLEIFLLPEEKKTKSSRSGTV
ncbi:para [Symbiodinium natans]|uniref:Para protein n=1 Tax=Symbiodinium natans TaxID=878477 RepID=A0A812MC32_9DINO|nr:para [Symbiodinium natans]